MRRLYRLCMFLLFHSRPPSCQSQQPRTARHHSGQMGLRCHPSRSSFHPQGVPHRTCCPSDAVNCACASSVQWTNGGMSPGPPQGAPHTSGASGSAGDKYPWCQSLMLIWKLAKEVVLDHRTRIKYVFWFQKPGGKSQRRDHSSVRVSIKPDHTRHKHVGLAQFRIYPIVPLMYSGFSAGKHIGIMGELNVIGSRSLIKAMSLS